MKLLECKILALYDLSHTAAGEYLAGFSYPWEALAGLGAFLKDLHPDDDFSDMGGGVYVHRTARIAPTAVLTGPCVIGKGSEVRQGAFLRGNVLVGKNCVVGNSSELKNCILFDGVQVPHFNYVGDSILGHRAHLGAGAMTSNLKSDRTSVKIKAEDAIVDTGSKKCGAFLGDGAEIGCNAVLCPGTVIGKNTTVYPLTMCRGAYPADSIVKHGGIVKKQ